MFIFHLSWFSGLGAKLTIRIFSSILWMWYYYHYISCTESSVDLWICEWVRWFSSLSKANSDTCPGKGDYLLTCIFICTCVLLLTTWFILLISMLGEFVGSVYVLFHQLHVILWIIDCFHFVYAPSVRCIVWRGGSCIYLVLDSQWRLQALLCSLIKAC